MDDTAPAVRRKFQFRLSTLILICLVVGLAVGLFLANQECRRLQEENARLKANGGEHVFFSMSADLTYHLAGQEAQEFIAVLNSKPKFLDHNPGGKPWGFFYVGNNVYSWYSGSITGRDANGDPSVWNDAHFSRMSAWCAARKFALSSDDMDDLFQAFMGQETSAPTPPDATNP